MKNYFKYFLIFVLCCVAVTSCKKKDTTDPYSAPFAKETVDQGKTNLSQAGQDLILQIQAMKDVNGASVIQSFSDFSSQSDPFAVKRSTAFSAIFATQSVISGKSNFSSVLKSLYAMGSDPQSLKEFYDSYRGVYDWNTTSKQWTKTTDSTQLTFNFPKTKDGTTNDAQMKMTYQGINGASLISGYSGDLPTAFDIAFSVSGAKVSEYSFTAAYNSTGVPTSVESFIALYPFKIGVSWAYSTSQVSLTYYFRNDTKTIVEFGGGVGGNFDKNNIDTATNEQNVIYNGNAYFQVLNVKLAGRIDYKSLATDLTNAEKISIDSLYAKAEVDAFNKDAALVLVYTDSNQKIAQAEAYVSKTEDYWGDTYYSSDFRFIFADGTKGDMQSYFSSGFSDLQNSFNQLVTDLNTKFGTSIPQQSK
jgi:hypothetical protein